MNKNRSILRKGLDTIWQIKLFLTQLPLWIPNLAKSFKLIRILDSGSSPSFGIGCIKDTGKGDDKIWGVKIDFLEIGTTLFKHSSSDDIEDAEVVQSVSDPFPVSCLLTSSKANWVSI